MLWAGRQNDKRPETELTPDVILGRPHMGDPAGVLDPLLGSEGHRMGQVVLPILLEHQVAPHCRRHHDPVLQKIHTHFRWQEVVQVADQAVGLPDLHKLPAVYLDPGRSWKEDYS